MAAENLLHTQVIVYIVEILCHLVGNFVEIVLCESLKNGFFFSLKNLNSRLRINGLELYPEIHE